MADKWTIYRERYNIDHYERLNIRVPAGFKEKIADRAAALGCSINAYIARLVSEDLGLEPAAWGMGLRPDPHRPRD